MRTALIIFFTWLLFGVRTPALAAIDIQEIRSESGITAWLIEDHNLPIIAMNFSFAAPDATGPAGVAAMASALLTEGAGSFDAQKFSEKLTNLAASISFSANDDYLTGSLRTQSRNYRYTFALLAECLLEPRLDDSSIERVRNATIASIHESQSDPDTVASQLWAKTFFENHRYGEIATTESVKSIHKSHIQKYLGNTIVKKRLTIGIAGDITPEQAKEILDDTFGNLPKGRGAGAVQSFQPRSGGGEVRQTMNLKQTVAVFGHAGIKRDDPDFYPATVMNYILGGGSFSSELMQQIRDQRGLAYSVYTNLDTMRDAGTISGYVATKSENFAESQQLIRDIWKTFPVRINDESVSAAKDYLLGSFYLRFSSTPQIAAILNAMQQDRLGIDFFKRRNDYVRAVTTDDVRRAAQRLLNPDQLLFATVGPEINTKPNNEPKNP